MYSAGPCSRNLSRFTGSFSSTRSASWPRISCSSSWYGDSVASITILCRRCRISVMVAAVMKNAETISTTSGQKGIQGVGQPLDRGFIHLIVVHGSANDRMPALVLLPGVDQRIRIKNQTIIQIVYSYFHTELAQSLGPADADIMHRKVRARMDN